MFEPEKVESVLWENLGYDGWFAPEVYDLGPGSKIEMVDVKEFNRLQSEFLKMRLLMKLVYTERANTGFHDDLQEEMHDMLYGDSE